jgi:glycosyltransferase involved in cell wall biosynthesis
MSHIREDSMQSYPFVSVIVPVRNSPERIKTCIEALVAQTYPHHRYEIIVVDNNSSDQTQQVIRSYPVTLLVETSMDSPYPTRNRGIRHARGEIIALLDANVTPTQQWLEQGVRTLEHEGADLAGGHITFTFSPKKTVGEMVDSILYVNIKDNIQQGTSVGGNLFVRKAVFSSIGLFPDHIRSGGDTLWTWKATQAGYKLVYAAKAEGLYPARRLLPLLKKSYRTTKGGAYIAKKQWGGLSARHMALTLIFCVFPIHPRVVANQIRQRGTTDMLERFLAIWLVFWLRKIVTTFGLLDGWLHLHNQKKAENQYSEYTADAE